MAAALIVPAAGFVATQSAGAAATPDNVVCTTNTGTIHFNPGMSLTTKHGSTVTTAVDGTLDSCTGVGIVDSTGAALRFSVRSAPVTCKTIKGATLTGKGTVRWNSGDTDSNAGIITPLKLKVRFVSLTTIEFTGSVRGAGYLGGEKIGGRATVPPDLRSSGDNDGKCGNSKSGRIHKLDYTNSADFTIGTAPAS